MSSWIRVERGIGRDPKVVALAATLGVSRAAAVGLLVGVLAGMAEHARDGALGEIADPVLELWADWQGTAGEFAQQFRRAFLDDAGLWPAWANHNGRDLAKQERDVERKRLARLQEEDGARPPSAAPAPAPGARRARGRRGYVTDVTDNKNNSTGAASAYAARAFALYQELHPKRQIVDTPAHRKRLAALEDAGVPLERVEAALRGNAQDPWCRQHRKHDLPFILRDDQLDRFADAGTPVLLTDPTTGALTEAGRAFVDMQAAA